MGMLGSAENDAAHDVVIGPDDSIYVYGMLRWRPSDREDGVPFLAAYTPDGRQLWLRELEE